MANRDDRQEKGRLYGHKHMIINHLSESSKLGQEFKTR